MSAHATTGERPGAGFADASKFGDDSDAVISEAKFRSLAASGPPRPAHGAEAPGPDSAFRFASEDSSTSRKQPPAFDASAATPRVMSGQPCVAPGAARAVLTVASEARTPTCEDRLGPLSLPSVSVDDRKSVAGFTEVQALEKRREGGRGGQNLGRQGAAATPTSHNFFTPRMRSFFWPAQLPPKTTPVDSKLANSSAAGDGPKAHGGAHPLSLLCRRCGAALTPRQGGRGRFPEFCGTRCREDHFNELATAERHAATAARRAELAGPCRTCGGPVTPSAMGPVARYCSPLCRDHRDPHYSAKLARQRAAPGRPARTRLCLQCDRAFSTIGRGRRELCSEACARERRRAVDAVRRLRGMLAVQDGELLQMRLRRLATTASLLVENAPRVAPRDRG